MERPRRRRLVRELPPAAAPSHVLRRASATRASMEEGNSKGVQDRVARSAGGEGAPVDKAAVVVRKTVKMPDTCDFIPDADFGGGSHEGSRSSAALLHVTSCAGSSEALSRDDGMQETPDYIRRGAAARHRIAPLELFSAAPSPAEPSPAKAAAPSALGAAMPEEGAGGAQEETMGCQTGQIEQGNRDCCGQLKQEYYSLLRDRDHDAAGHPVRDHAAGRVRRHVQGEARPLELLPAAGGVAAGGGWSCCQWRVELLQKKDMGATIGGGGAAIGVRTCYHRRRQTAVLPGHDGGAVSEGH